MLTPSLILATLLATQGVPAGLPTRTPGTPTRVRTRQQASPPLPTNVSLNPAFQNPPFSGQVSLGGTPSSLSPTSLVRVLSLEGPGVYRMVANDPGTGIKEFFLLGIPTPLPAGDHPMLVMFHSFSVSERDAYTNGFNLFEGARSRGWFVLAPLGSHDLNFGSQEAQVNTAYVIDLISGLVNVDQDRIYGAGFSMGGGWMMSYAAQHQAVGKPRLAALVNNAGTASIAYTYWNSSAQQQQNIFEHPRMFGGSPLTEAHAYSRASIIDIDPAMTTVDLNLVDPNTDMARNLADTPVLHYLGSIDPNPGLVTATQTANAWLATMLGFDSTLNVVAGAGHDWTTIQVTAALDFLQSKTLVTPTTSQHRMLADSEGSWSHFYVYQTAGGAMTPFRWEAIPAGQNNARLVIDETKNLQQIVVNMGTLGLDPMQPLDVVMDSADASEDRILLTGYTTQPASVTRAGVPVTVSTSAPTYWHWDPVGQTVILVDANPDPNVNWTVTP